MKKTRCLIAVSSVAMAATILLHARDAWAATPIEGALLGQVRDLDTSAPVPGVTVVASGPEGDVSAVTDGKGGYQLLGLPIGRYAIRFHRGDVFAEREATISVDKTVRVNIRLPAVPAQVETVAAPYAAPAIDVGSSRIGTTFTAEFMDSTPNQGLDVASLIQKTPGGYNDDVGLSLSGGTGADNAYYIEGLNVTGIKNGLLGTNLRVAFLEEAEVISAGYGAEYGRAMGGIVNMALKSGTNEWKGSAFSSIAPGFLAGSRRRILSDSTVLTGVTEPDYATQIGLEVGGPIIKNKLFLWVGYAPEINRSHFVQSFDRFREHYDASTGKYDGTPETGLDGLPIRENLFTRVIPGEATTHNYAGKITWRLAPEHVLSLSLVGIRKDEEYMYGANMDIVSGMTHRIASSNDIIARWQSAFFQRKWRIDASLGIHMEGYSERSPFGDAESANAVYSYNSPSLTQFYPQLGHLCSAGFVCPVQGFQSGGYGQLSDTSALRVAGQLKSTNVFSAFGLHELKYGFDYEFNQYDNRYWLSGTDGQRWLAYPGGSSSQLFTMFRLPYGTSLFDYPDQTVLAQPPYYQDRIHAVTQAFNQAVFVQESYLPLPNLTVNLGLRWEAQQMKDYKGNTALSINDSLAPRIGIVYDPTKEGHSKIFAHYGRYYESIPLDLADRVFGGQGSMIVDYCHQITDTCTGATPFVGAADRLYVQPNIKGSYNNEVVLGAQYQLLRDWVVGASVIYRWLARIIEDTGGSLANGTGPSILANPGSESASELSALGARADALAKDSNASPETKAAAAARAKALAHAAQMPDPERTYKAIQLTVQKRLARNWFFAGSYTYSRTMGNFTGLYDAVGSQLNPNNSAQYDVLELMANHHGPLPNDRPHVVHLDGYYQLRHGKHSLVPGISFLAQSGQPVTPLGYDPTGRLGYSYILPRGSAGRTPFLTQLDLHVSYRMGLPRIGTVEVFADVFNVLNQRKALTVDALYTTDSVMPANGGTPLSQVPMVDSNGKPTCRKPDDSGTCTTVDTAQPNPNYRHATSYQAPISGRVGMRVFF